MRINEIHLENYKNISKSKIEFKSSMSAIYGPNGTGKTAIVEVINILNNFYQTYNPEKEEVNLLNIKDGSNHCTLKYYITTSEIQFCFIIKYIRNDNEVSLSKEEVMFRFNNKGRKGVFKNVYSIEDSTEIYPEIRLFNKVVNIDNYDSQLIKNLYKGFYSNQTTLVSFLNALTLTKEQDAIKEVTIICANQIAENISVVTIKEQGFQNIKLLLPFTFSLNNARGKIAYHMGENSNRYSEKTKDVIGKIISQISDVFDNLVVGSHLILESHFIESVNNENYYSLKLLVSRNNITTPIEQESTGIIKLVSILSLIIKYYNTPNFVAVIDELDAHLFEFLLARFLKVLNKGAKGQLIFTAHNLSPMETLERENLILSTFIDGTVKFNYFSKTTKSTNMRNKYIRAYSLGSEDNIKVNNLSILKLEHSLNNIELEFSYGEE